jgi:predicted signal transduction protein with EAL and GGDEF domain
MSGPGQAEEAALALCKAIREPARLGDVLVSVGCSAGLAVFPDTATSANLLFDRADFALYHAKNQKRGQCVLFSEELERLSRSEQALDSALQGADLARELSLVFQPIVATDDLDPTGVECLARWHSPRLGQVAPELLIASAERIGRSREVTLALFGMALEALAELPSRLRISFNLSGTDLCNAGTIDALIFRIEESGCDARRLLIEITESSLITELDRATDALQRLRKAGAQIALDAFGTGYSSLSSLHQLPLDMVKIDRSFAARLDEAAGRRLITAIRHLARSLSLECVIEGIETENQLVSARLAGFSLAQGYFIARPMSLDAMLDRLRQPGLAMWAKAG